MPSLSSPAARPSGALIASGAFALLVVATLGAFFVTTRLKRSAPIVNNLTFARYLSPNGDGRHDSVDIGFRLKRSDEVTVSLVDEDGDEIRTLASDVELEKGRHRFRWSGQVDAGIEASNGPTRAGGILRAPDGEYRVRVGLRRQGRSITSPRKLFVDTKPPRPVVRYVSPDSLSPDGAGAGNQARLRFDGPQRMPARLLVYRTGLDGQRLVAHRTGKAGSHELTWDGLVGLGRRKRAAPSGSYLLVVRVRDAAGNVGPPLPADHPPGHPGLIVSYVSVRGPLEPVRTGSIARLVVDADGRRYRWRLRRLGSSRVRGQGSSRSERLGVRVPRGRSSVWLLEVRVGKRRSETPLAVQGRSPQRVLVVLPTVTWQATNRLDSDSDGYPDTLYQRVQVPLRRPFLHGLPEGFTRAEAPLLRFLDRERLRYDLTTDLALTASSARPPIRYAGILFAAAPAYFPASVGRLVRSYVESGGRVGWVGTGWRYGELGGFSQAARAAGGRLLRGRGGPRFNEFTRNENLFGERLAAGRPAGPVVVLADRIGFFRGVGGSFGPFPALEEARALPRGARLLASAAREADRPSIVVYRHGKGVIARVGVDGFATAAHSSPDVARIMRRLWTLLSR